MEHQFIECTEKPETFFSKLPEDWQEGIVPYWPEYQQTARIYILHAANEVLGGGIVFSSVSPDTQVVYKQEAQSWFDQGYLYIGFLWFAEEHRGKQLGSQWLKHLFARNSRQKFWLAIDDYKLSSFYQRNGFSLVERIELPEGDEWVLTMDAQESLLQKEHQPKASLFSHR